MLYVDGLVTALPVTNKETYRRLVTDAIPLMRAYGAINVVHCSDQNSDDYPSQSSNHNAKSVVLFSWIIWPSRQVRDQGMEKMLSDPRFDEVMNPIALDGERIDLDASFSPKLH
ncbi:hypothetical protein A1OO_12505 [Enterovibrio norvegicus FF-33]|uniref:DUF1428 domain-containing protein n=1 Tax=Enterovibrio norvegicus FF-454 TaxID=1185651 RepID=A0A1E5C9C7_9GAMM|nr:DUF1428 domain-containing protein [Enterovibrio norvegicus]OEE61792.1 hypothetical protein A1OK_08520 [Enterovibrio norvegicus FF-454]OEE66589.1 hypothetical protein A1OO_12505 [Enterovibrio norvegicus FF-33]OEE77611.1 hypothetical protein A1OQ_00780 [Enterovibrio norvegicus FF-162]